MSRTPFGALSALALIAVAGGLIEACASDDSGLLAQPGAGASGAGGAGGGLGLNSTNAVGTGSTGSTNAATGSTGSGNACTTTGQPCAKPDECCSKFCIDAVCIDGGSCSASGTECTKPEQCCSGRCEPETGTGKVKCQDFCRGDGAACTKALDCCSLACNGGVCGGTMCAVESSNCTSNADCCSNICDPQKKQCAIDVSNPDCRPTGETCNAGPGSGCCQVCDKASDKCIYGAGVCHGEGAGCQTDADCCKGTCQKNAANQLVCLVPCVVTGDACAFSAECCGVDCNGGNCGPPVGGCAPTGNACTKNADCCGGLCLGGFCDVPCKLSGVGCAGNGDCCSGVCDVTCKPPIQ